MAAKATGAPSLKGRLRSLALVLAIIAMSAITPGAQAATSLGDYFDTFSLISYNNSNGTLDWSGPWNETGDDNSPSTGAIKIAPEPNCDPIQCLIIGKSGGDDATVRRTADLRGADRATLTFSRKIHRHGGGDGRVTLWVKGNAGGWSRLATWALDRTDSSVIDEEFDLTPWMASSTTIEFALEGGADDSHMNVDNLRIELFDDDNVAPVLDPIPDQTIDEEVPFAFIATADDANPGDELTFSLDGNEPAGAAITADGDFTWTPTEAQGPGTYSFEVKVLDDGTPVMSDSQMVTLIVEEVNDPPTLNPIGDKNVEEHSQLSFTATGSDAETAAGDLLYALLGSVPTGAAITDGGNFTWTPTEAQGPGSYTFRVKVYDDGSPQASDEETITVTVSEDNEAPTMIPIGDRSVDEGNELTFAANVSDPDLPANDLTFSLNGAPQGAAISSSGVFTWTPTDAQGPGIYTFRVIVVDDGSPQLSDYSEVTITVAEANIPPSVHPLGPQTVAEKQLLQFIANATDPDSPANSFDFSLEGAPPGAAITPGGQFTWTPTEAQGPGTYHFDIVATDDGVPAMAGSRSVTVSVTEVNTAPILDPIPEQFVDEGNQLTILTSASDQDVPGNTLTYSLVNGPAGATISPTGLFTWIPDDSQGPDVYEFDVKVKDNGSPALSDRQTLKITVADGNNAPIIDPLGTFQGTEGSLITFTATAADPDVPADDFTFRLFGNAPTGATMTPGGVFSWIPEESQGPGSYTFDVKVTDDGSPARSSYESVTVTVDEANEPPVLELAEEFIAEGGSVFTMVASASDPDLPSQRITYEANGLPEDAEFTSSGVLSWTPPADAVGGDYLIWITATDDGSPALSDTAAFRLSVISENLPPVIEPIGAIDALVGEPVTFTAVATDEDGDDSDLRFSLAADAPAAAGINAVTGSFHWTPADADDATAHSFWIIATDAGPVPKSGSTLVTVTVGRPNMPPLIAAPPDQTHMPGDSVTVYVGGSDPDRFPEPKLLYSASNLPPGLEINSETGEISGVPGFDGIAGSPFEVQVNVYDGDMPAAATFVWTITGVANPPESTPTKAGVISGIIEATSQPAEVDGDEPQSSISRSLVLMSRAARSGINEMSMPFLLLFLGIGIVLAFGRIGLVPMMRRGTRHAGVLRRLDLDTGSGLVVRNSDDAEVFVHVSAISRRDRRHLAPGDSVIFRTVDGAYRDLVTKLRRKR